MSVAIVKMFLCKLSNLGFFCKYNLNYKSFNLLFFYVLRCAALL